VLVEALHGGLIYHAAPAGSAHLAKATGVPGHEEGFRFAITTLLAEEGADRGAAVMPDHGGGSEGNTGPCFLKPPTEIDIVAGSVARVAGIGARVVSSGARVVGCIRHVVNVAVFHGIVAGSSARVANSSSARVADSSSARVADSSSARVANSSSARVADSSF
jgi:hypothetical protein